MRLDEIARVIRSKNAGPRVLTLDVMLASAADFERVRHAPALEAASIARLYGVDAAQVRVIAYPLSQAIKITLPRPVMAGAVEDRDVYGAQQHARLLDLQV